MVRTLKNTETAYKVTDVIVHRGSPKGGHYFTTHYNEDKNEWEKIDDQLITKLSPLEARKINKEGIIFIMRKIQDEHKEVPNKCLNKGLLEDLTLLNQQKNGPSKERSENPWSMVPKDRSPFPNDIEYPHLPNLLNHDALKMFENTNQREKRKNSLTMIPKANKENYANILMINKKDFDEDNPNRIEQRKNPWSMEPKSNKRHYVDRDNPNKEKPLCWWHKKNICKYGKDCWYSHQTKDDQKLVKNYENNTNSRKHNEKQQISYKHQKPNLPEKEERYENLPNQTNDIKETTRNEKSELQTKSANIDYILYKLAKLLLSGDIETNPGPKKYKQKKPQIHLIRLLIIILITIGQIKKEQIKLNMLEVIANHCLKSIKRSKPKQDKS